MLEARPIELNEFRQDVSQHNQSVRLVKNKAEVHSLVIHKAKTQHNSARFLCVEL